EKSELSPCSLRRIELLNMDKMKTRSLNPEQEEAVSCLHGVSLIIAGAGTGKTHTLIYKVMAALEKGIAPSSILLLTFTNKAAAEMLRRVEMYRGYPVPEITGGTFHSVAVRLLRRYGDHVGISPHFTIMDRDDSSTLLGQIKRELNAEIESDFPKKTVLQSMVSLLRNKGCSLTDLLESRYPQWKCYEDELEKIFTKFAKRKKDSLSLDFDDLLCGFLMILQNETIRRELTSKFTHVFVDEYQDTNKIQDEIIRGLCSSSTNLTVVGDDAQSIYSFRGARFRNILDFPDVFKKSRMFKLQINYRSTPEILEFANAVIKNNSAQFPKNLVSGSMKHGAKPEIYCFFTEKDQGYAVAGMIAEQIQNGMPPSNIAVLYRAHFQSLAVQLILTKNNIPFEIVSGLRFSEQAHVKDMLAFGRIIVNPLDRVSWTRVLAMFPGVGQKSIEKILEALPAPAESFSVSDVFSRVDSCLPPKARSAWKSISGLILMVLEHRTASPEAILGAVFESAFFNDYLGSSYENTDQRKDDLNQLIGLSGSFPDMESFLSEMSLLSSIEEPDKQKGNRVLLTTIHQAKGLEWDTVYIIGLVEGRFPMHQTFSSLEEMEEERRLFYVASTRAKKELTVTFHTIDENARSGSYYLKPSRFITELDSSLYSFHDCRRY
ncbi:MAG: ATP-dependent helicase, partial [Candidatus Aureabacteria bacterium]|nr:ATP-dependent helicase [Candidatus Auribacterota bacterium]